MLKNELNIEASWDRFFIDFWWVLGCPGEAKMCSKCRTLIKFWVFARFNISCLLDTKKCGFWVRFGSQVRLQKRPSWLKTPLGAIPLQLRPPRPPPASKQDGPRGLQNGPRPAKTVFLSQHGPMLAPTWTHVGTKIAFRRYLMLKQPES